MSLRMLLRTIEKMWCSRILTCQSWIRTGWISQPRCRRRSGQRRIRLVQGMLGWLMMRAKMMMWMCRRLTGGEKRMTDFEIWGDLERFRTAGKESYEHLWAKVELNRRREAKSDPWFSGEYWFEKKAADRVPDCLVRGGPVNRWIEIVAGSDQPYRAKTREALRLGCVVHWVFHVEHREQQAAAREALEPELDGPFEFGEYDPLAGELDVGMPITFENYTFPAERFTEFQPGEILGYRSGKARIARRGNGWDLGLFDLAGSRRQLIAVTRDGRCFESLAPGQPIEDAAWRFPTKDGVKALIEEERITRLGPVGQPGNQDFR